MDFYLCRHMIRKKSEEAFIAFKEALKYKFVIHVFLPTPHPKGGENT